MNIVLVPGYMLDSDLWADVEPGLKGLGTLSHADLSRDDSIEAMARRLLDDAPDRFVLIGFSLGGYVARAAARREPHRVRALVLIATSARGDSDIQARRKATVTPASNVSKAVGLSRSAILSSLAADHADEARVARIRAMGDRLGRDVFHRQSNLARASDLDRLGEIDCPTLIVAATEDRLRSLDEARELHNAIGHSTLSIIAGSGHMIPLEMPDELSARIRNWLSSVL